MVMQSWEPFGGIVSLRDAMDRLFEQSVVRPPQASAETAVASVRLLPVDVYEKESDYIVKAYVPGARADNVEISTERGVLTLKAHIPGGIEQGEEAKSWKWLATELGCGDAMRVLTFPSPIDAGKIEAQVENGVLTVVVPKAEEAKPKKIVVKAK